MCVNKLSKCYSYSENRSGKLVGIILVRKLCSTSKRSEIVTMLFDILVYLLYENTYPAMIGEARCSLGLSIALEISSVLFTDHR